MFSRLLSPLMLPWMFTISRMLLAPVAFHFLRIGRIKLVLAIICYATVSDFLDGYFARRNNVTTSIGALADAVADKTFINLTSLSFCFYIKPYDCFLQYILAIWFVRDVVLTLLWAFTTTEFKSLYIGKVYTALQFLFIFLVALAAIFNIEILGFSYIMFFVFLFLGVFSAKDYFALFLGR